MLPPVAQTRCVAPAREAAEMPCSASACGRAQRRQGPHIPASAEGSSAPGILQTKPVVKRRLKYHQIVTHLNYASEQCDWFWSTAPSTRQSLTRFLFFPDGSLNARWCGSWYADNEAYDVIIRYFSDIRNNPCLLSLI